MSQTTSPHGRRSLPVLPIGGGRAAESGGAPVLSARPRSGDVGAGPSPRPRIRLLTLGCDKNTVDSERILGALHGAGADAGAMADIPGSAAVGESRADADVVIVNTCGFIDLAKEESIEAILQASRLKEDGRIGAVVVMGCLVQRYRSELEAELPEVDIFLGLAEAHRLVPELRTRGLIPPAGSIPTMERPLRMLSTRTPHTSHLKVSEGCDHGCAFCAIPLMRGKHRSTPLPELVREARELESRGVVELNLVSQDTTWYGRDWVRARPARTGAPAESGDEAASKAGAGALAADAEASFMGRPFSGMSGFDAARAAFASFAPPALPPGMDPARVPRRGMLPELLRAVLESTSIPWIRLFYMYPSGITPELVQVLAREERIVPYLDMPIQHGSDRILALMRRPERRATIRDRVERLRSAIPDLSLRTTVIVGFPGESDEDFADLVDLLEEVRFDYLGAFSYSPEEGTPAASMREQVPEHVRRERLERVLDVQRMITHERNEARVGGEELVLVDRAADDAAGLRAVGRTRGQALEVDGVVYLDRAWGVRPGQFVRVCIREADGNDMVGQMSVEKA